MNYMSKGNVYAKLNLLKLLQKNPYTVTMKKHTIHQKEIQKFRHKKYVLTNQKSEFIIIIIVFLK